MENKNRVLYNNIIHTFTAGFIAILVNTLMLKLAPLLKVRAESGGVLKLFLINLPVKYSSIEFLHGTTFWVIFHFLIGYSMVFMYLFTFVPMKSLGWMQKGILFSFIPWLINSIVILPLLNHGIMGIKTLEFCGILYFFISNLIFALILAYLLRKV